MIGERRGSFIPCANAFYGILLVRVIGVCFSERLSKRDRWVARKAFPHTSERVWGNIIHVE
jgi:hypothetical protein